MNKLRSGHKGPKRHTYEEKRAWVLSLLEKKWEQNKRTTSPPLRFSICAIEDQEAWEAAFGGKTNIYTLGPNVSPDFARTLRRMWKDGDLSRLVGGNQESRRILAGLRRFRLSSPAHGEFASLGPAHNSFQSGGKSLGCVIGVIASPASSQFSPRPVHSSGPQSAPASP